MLRLDRRGFLRASGSYAALGLVTPYALFRPRPLWSGRQSPLAVLGQLGPSVLVDGVPFATDFTGDRFTTPGQHPPFPSLTHWLGPNVPPPAPTEDVDVVIVGGGLSGLCTAHLLHARRVLLLEHNWRVGGNAQAESWGGLAHSLGGAYCIEPDEPLASLYRELGLDRIVRVTPGPPGPDPVEVDGQLVDGFWYGAGRPPEERERFLAFVDLVTAFGETYPDIPLPAEDDEWIRDLDRVTFKDDIESRIGPLPPLLESAVQHYCWSSFGAGWDELSAASGWNFLAAEQYGQWVFPGGTVEIARRLWERVVAAGRTRIATRTVALDVRPLGQGVAVTYGLPDGSVRAVRARRVVMACPKFVCKWIMPEYLSRDDARRAAISALDYRAYVVANVLLERGEPDRFYDAFLLDDGSLPGENETTLQSWHRVLDAVSAGWCLGGTRSRATLTLYWPLPWGTGRGFVLGDDAFGDVSSRLVAQLDRILSPFGFERGDVRQIRLTRWGHAMPIAAPNFIASGFAERVREPIDRDVYFVNQDNWALPAVETALLEAFEFAPRVR